MTAQDTTTATCSGSSLFRYPTYRRFAPPAHTALQWHMPTLTRRRYPQRPDCWHVYYGDVHVGEITSRPGVPVHVDQWGWQCGFYPLDHRGRSFGGTAATFDLARVGFEAAWESYLLLCTAADFAEHRRQRAWTDWKYAMRDARLPLPTQMSDGRARCFCGDAIDIKGIDPHIREAHMIDLQSAHL